MCQFVWFMLMNIKSFGRLLRQAWLHLLETHSSLLGKERHNAALTFGRRLLRLGTLG